MNDLQRKTCVAIVNVFETGSPRGDYGAVTVLPGDSGHLTYGRTQTTLGSGNLYVLLKQYCEAPDAYDAAELQPYLPRLQARDVSLDHDAALKAILRGAGNDPTMRQVQEDFFGKCFLQPAIDAAEAQGLTTALSATIVYDSFIQGAWSRIRERVLATVGPVSVRVPEDAWAAEYIAQRLAFLEESGAPLSSTAYRMHALGGLVDAHNWDLEVPLTVHGVAVTADDLADTAVLARPRITIADTVPQESEPVLRSALPYLRGDQVVALQKALAAHGLANPLDGLFGPYTQALVRYFQSKNGLKVDGIVGPATWAGLRQQGNQAAQPAST